MPHKVVNDLDRTALSVHILDRMEIAVTVVDPEGIILYYNDFSSRILDRRPEHVGRDVRFCHQKAESIAAIDRILADFASGARREAGYRVIRNGRRMSVKFVPLVIDGRFVGCIQTVIPEDDPPHE